MESDVPPLNPGLMTWGFCLFAALFCFLFCSFGYAYGLKKFPGQGSNPHHSSDTTRSVTHWTTRELLWWLSWSIEYEGNDILGPLHLGFKDVTPLSSWNTEVWRGDIRLNLQGWHCVQSENQVTPNHRPWVMPFGPFSPSPFNRWLQPHKSPQCGWTCDCV